MKSALFLVAAVLVGSVFAGDEVRAWRGEELGAWTKRTSRCRDVLYADGVVRGVVVEADPQLNVQVAKPFLPNPVQAVHVKLKVPAGGRGQFFWGFGDEKLSEGQSVHFELIGDGQWHDYCLRPGWVGQKTVNALRLDLPNEFAGGTPFELGEVRIVMEGTDLDVDSSDKIGVAFSLQMPVGVHYCTIVWTSDFGRGFYNFVPATDGKRHDYWFTLRDTSNRGWGTGRGLKTWKGRIHTLTVEQRRYDRVLPVENLRIIGSAPDVAPDAVVQSVTPLDAIPRAGRPFAAEIVLRNFGTRPMSGIRLVVDGLPAGVKILNPEALTIADSLPGADGTSSIWYMRREEPVNEKIVTLRLSDPGPGELKFTVTMTAVADGTATLPGRDGAPSPSAVARCSCVAKVLPSLGLAKVDYPPEPKPISTAPYEVGALLFPGWTSHPWHPIRDYAPWRKPVLGWYDEENPETIDWQIKHLVENGISWVSVDWYWCKGRFVLNHWMRAFAKAKYRRYLKWHLMWANHNGRGAHSRADQELVTRYWIDNYFRDPQYQTYDGMPIVVIWDKSLMEADYKAEGGCRALLEVSQKVAREAGLKGIYFVSMRGDREERAYLSQFPDYGFSRTCVYKYTGGIKGCPVERDGSRPFKWLAETSLGHWRRVRENSPLPFWPSLSTAWDDRPWRGEDGWEITGINPVDFRRICADAKTFSDESGERMLLLGPLDEWGEGSIGYPNAEHGFGMLEAVRDVFGKKPSSGWPLNYTPADVGLVCPERIPMRLPIQIDVRSGNR